MELYFKIKDADGKEQKLTAINDVQVAAFEKAGMIETDKTGKPLPDDDKE